jgi:hypothetical protein
MPCNVKFNFVSVHNGEYWYKCRTCGAREWFGRRDKPAYYSPLSGCKAKQFAHLTREQLVIEILKYQGQISLIEDWLGNFPIQSEDDK